MIEQALALSTFSHLVQSFREDPWQRVALHWSVKNIFKLDDLLLMQTEFY